ncbi:MAG: hypothetical protein JNL08_09680 [Planctomycetes bacterium]|nr:hypothetical protein [Planctomycetota bacterium]
MGLAATNLVNSGLMLAAAAAAFVVPFETFLLAYAVLGPLHYLTQIAWLHERSYFAPQRRDAWPLVAVTVGVTALAFLQPGGSLLAALVLWAMAWALLAIATPDRGLRIAGGVVAAVAALLLHGLPPVTMFATTWLPTLVHVFVFTGLFVLYGTVKHRSATGWLSLGVFVACGIATLAVPVGNLGYVASDYAREAYAGSMGNMHANLLRSSGLAELAVPGGGEAGMYAPFTSLLQMLSNEVSVQLGRFVAFAYTYHYLNWFSKTSVIRWHHVPRPWLVLAVLGWIASVALYAFDYETGLRWLFLLSLLHVMLELPLDWQTLLAIPRELAARRASA